MLTQRGVGAALVAGASAPAAERQLRVRVLRAFLWDGAVQPVGEILTMPYRDARQFLGWLKVEEAPEEPAVKASRAKSAEKEEG